MTDDELEMILSARTIARVAHWGQTRKWSKNEPYFNHCRAVADRVALLPDVQPSWVAAAYLHDVLEDTGCHPDAIESVCNREVFLLVCELTNPSKGSNAPRSERKRMDRDHYRTASRAARMIKMVDRTHNLNSMDAAPEDFKRLYATESVGLYEILKTEDSALAGEMKEAIDRLIGRE